MRSTVFFEIQQPPSKVKSLIASQYFKAWAMVMTGTKSKESNVGYIDLFAGPGMFDDGSESTPILILKDAIGTDRIKHSLWSYFNDRDQGNIDSLRREISSLAGVECLVHEPGFNCELVSPAIADYLRAYSLRPTFVFADPFGYVGISLQLLDRLLKHKKSELLVFFNTNRISPGVANPFVKEHIDALFGVERAAAVRQRVRDLHGLDREEAVLDSFEEAMRNGGFAYITRFRFASMSQHRTSHHLIHCSRHPKGEEIMKDIMARHSHKRPDGVATFEFKKQTIQRSLFDQEAGYTEPPEELAEAILRVFAGRTMTLAEVWRAHAHGTNFVERNYREALLYLEAQGKISVEPPSAVRGTRNGQQVWGSDTRARFPRQ
jgi:three-Cys-motif partner protein